MPLQGTLNILRIDICQDLNLHEYVKSDTMAVTRMLGTLNKVRRFFSREQLCLLYKTQICSCMEYCSHLYDDSAKYFLNALDRLSDVQLALSIVPK